ncbi:hypothetical protein N9C07_05590 [Flavobacteriaceae bacterium]|nr:hypothetical protein [Flavobacteriaceae bacterium]
MIFAILNSLEYPIPRTHYLHVKKFSLGFFQNGYTVIELKKTDDILLLSSDSLVYISNHYYIERIRRPLRTFLHKKLLKYLNISKVIPILWSFHDIPVIQDHLENRKHIYLTENYSKSCVKKFKKLSFYNDKLHHKLIYSSYLDDRIDYSDLPWKIYIKQSFNYVGSVYKSKILNAIKNNTAYKSEILFHPPVQSEIKRINSFSSSSINLVFHSDSNIEHGVITERFPEAMSMGNFIIHDHPKISEDFTSKGIVYYDNINYIYHLINRLKLDDVLECSKLNYTLWQNSKMSYRKQAIEIINKIK